MKEYAPRSRGTPPPEVPFVMIFLRDGVEEKHEFTACPTMSWQDYRRLVPLLRGTDNDVVTPETIEMIDRLIRRALRNDDGTPEKWTPSVVDGHFTAPNGDHMPLSLLPGLVAFDAGSSRRRWVHLMQDDDEVTIEPEQISELMIDLIEAAAARPTTRSVPSPA